MFSGVCVCQGLMAFTEYETENTEWIQSRMNCDKHDNMECDNPWKSRIILCFIHFMHEPALFLEMSIISHFKNHDCIETK